MLKNIFKKAEVGTAVSETESATNGLNSSVFFSGGKKMGKRIFYTVLLFAVIDTCVFAMESNLKNNKSEQQKPYYATFFNGTGKTITRITFRPEQEQKNHGASSKNLVTKTLATHELSAAEKEEFDGDFSFSFELKDKEIKGISLPSKLRQYDSISIEIELDNEKTVKMGKNDSITLSDEQADNMFLLSFKGKKSTIPFVAAGTAGGVTVGAIAATSAYCAAQWGAGGITWLLAAAGGTMATGIAVIATAPVVATALATGVAYGVQHFLLPDTLEVQRLSSDQVLLHQENN